MAYTGAPEGSRNASMSQICNLHMVVTIYLRVSEVSGASFGREYDYKRLVRVHMNHLCANEVQMPQIR